MVKRVVVVVGFVLESVLMVILSFGGWLSWDAVVPAVFVSMSLFLAIEVAGKVAENREQESRTLMREQLYWLGCSIFKSGSWQYYIDTAAKRLTRKNQTNVQDQIALLIGVCQMLRFLDGPGMASMLIDRAKADLRLATNEVAAEGVGAWERFCEEALTTLKA